VPSIPVRPYMILRQATEVNGKISFVFYVKVDNDPGSERIPVSVGQAAFIIGASMLGALEAKKILSDTDHEGPRDVPSHQPVLCPVHSRCLHCQVRTCKRAWRSKHYVSVPLVSRGKLLGV